MVILLPLETSPGQFFVHVSEGGNTLNIIEAWPNFLVALKHLHKNS